MKPHAFWGTTLIWTLSCGQPRPESTPLTTPTRPESAESLFMRGAFTSAIAAYDRELQGESTPAVIARAQFLRAVARLAVGNPEAKELAKQELWRLEHEHSTTLWGVLARLYLGEVTRGRVLRQTILHAGAELHRARERIGELESELARVGDNNAELEQTLTALKEERGRLQWQLKELQDKNTAQETRIRDLEESLAALKRIDMQRQP